MPSWAGLEALLRQLQRVAVENEGLRVQEKLASLLYRTIRNIEMVRSVSTYGRILKLRHSLLLVEEHFHALDTYEFLQCLLQQAFLGIGGKIA